MTRRMREDEGAILVFALIIVTTVALVTGAVLTRGDGSLRATVALREVAGSTYAADGAAQIAINDLRTGYGFAGNPNESAFNNNLDGTGCFGQDASGNPINTLPLDDFYPATGALGASSALVECAGDTGTGMQGSPVPITDANKPGYALVTLGGPVSAAGSKAPGLNVYGGVYSNGSVVGPVSVQAGDLWAHAGCSGTVTAVAKNCSAGIVPDPGYASDLGGAVPPLQTPPTSCTNGVAIFTPGYYDNAATLNTATNLCSVAWFEPGAYYFDFHNDSCANVCPSSLFGAGDTSSDVWTISGKTVIGGTPVDAAGHVLAQPPSTATVPGACESPINDVHALGVQFVFGGNSHIYVDQKSSVELCGTYHSGTPPIELYGLKSGSTPTATSATGLSAASVTSPGAFTGATAATLAAADGTSASWTGTKAVPQSTTVTLQGFQPGATVPSGAVLTSATLHVTHRDADNTGASQGNATLTVGSTTTSALAVPATSTATTANIAITGADLTNLQKQVHDHGYTAASVAYTAKMSMPAKATLDAITLDLKYYLPVLRGETGTCIDASAGSCQFFSMAGGNNMSQVYFQGTTYVPAGDISLMLGNFSAEVAKFGIVARQFEFNVVNGDVRWTGPVIEVPDNSPGYGYQNTTVDLKVHLCPGRASGCTIADPVALTARVQLWDPSGSPSPPGRQVSITSWSHPR